ncbi:MAG: redoxin family protein, partial [Dysgonamonadaceae bacterium]|nr:redoxin family protein [Dysgonamonadaceae bacterium]
AKAIFLDDKAISSFRDLAQTHELKGGYVYIDLWASWCSPCLAQFKYNGQLHELLAGYGNIQTVYISIDEDREEKTWRKQIDFHSLDGYHIRASKPLVNYISSALYEGKSVAVPRYLILNKNGDILDANLPRPSQITQLKEVLDQVIGKK